MFPLFFWLAVNYIRIQSGDWTISRTGDIVNPSVPQES